MPNAVRYLVFDTESVADAALVAKLRYAGEGLSPGEAVRRYRDELMAKYESDFVPYSFQVPISVAVGKVTADFRLEDVVVLDEPQFRPARDYGKLLAGLGEIPPAHAGELQRPGFRLAALGIGGFSLWAERARLVSKRPASPSSSPAAATISWPTSTCTRC